MSEEITSDQITFILVSVDAGPIYEITCPECKNKVRWAQYRWWNCQCECGFVWSVEIKAIGRK